MTSQKNDMPDGGEAKSPLVDTTLSSDPYFSLLSEAAWNAKSFVEHDVPDLQIRKMYHRARSIVRHSGMYYLLSNLIGVANSCTAWLTMEQSRYHCR